jgi:hypothetical protein
MKAAVSIGVPEFLVHNNNAQILQAEENYRAAQQAGITVLASAGDFCATNSSTSAKLYEAFHRKSLDLDASLSKGLPTTRPGSQWSWYLFFVRINPVRVPGQAGRGWRPYSGP